MLYVAYMSLKEMNRAMLKKDSEGEGVVVLKVNQVSLNLLAFKREESCNVKERIRRRGSSGNKGELIFVENISSSCRLKKVLHIL